MKQFVVIYHAPPSAMEKMKNSSPEDMKKGMEEWMKWAENHKDDLDEMGNPFGKNMKVTASGAEAASNSLAGYSIVNAESQEAAAAWSLD